MGRPSKTVVYNANVTALGDVAEPTRALGTKVLDAAGTVHGTIIDLEWEGDGKDGRTDRQYRNAIESEHVQFDTKEHVYRSSVTGSPGSAAVSSS